MMELLILLVLHDEICSIYRIKQKIDEIFSIFFKVSFGAVYPALKKMEKNRLVSVKSHISPGGQQKLSYSITEEGKKYFEELMLKDLSDNPSTSSQLIEIKVLGLSKLKREYHKAVLTSILFYLEKQKSKIQNYVNIYNEKNEKFQQSFMKLQLKKVLEEIQWIEALTQK